MKHLLVYRSNPEGMEKAPVHFEAHRARWREFEEAGTLLMIGPYADRTGALAVFTTRKAAEEFAKSDPFVLNGVVERWEIVDWLEALVPS